MASSIGQASCPECGHTETVMSDGRKYYIKCSVDDCRTFTNFQARAAKLRIKNRLTPVNEPERQTDKPPEKTPPPKAESESKPEPKPARANDVLDSLEDLF